MSEWKEVELGEIINLKRGYDLPNSNRVGGGVPIISSSGVTGCHNLHKEIGPGVVTGRYGTLGEFYYIKPGEKYWPLNTTLFVEDFKGNDPEFIYYLLSTLGFGKLGHKSAVPGLNRNELHEILVGIPDSDTQKEIARTLSIIDKKITLLHQQNRDLEELAQTLFKRWFVEFEFPNENGESYKSSGGKMVESELGEIPDGWRVGVITELFEVKDGTHDSPKQKIEGKKLITSKHLSSFRLNDDDAYLICEEDFNKINRRSKVEQFDILFSMIGTIGLTYFEQNETVEYAIKNVALLKTSQNTKWAIYTYLWLTSCLGKNFITANKSGSTQEYISLSSLRNIEFCIPSEFIINIFDEGLAFIFHKISNNANEVDTLTKFRDTLLPKLMRGELSVKK